MRSSTYRDPSIPGGNPLVILFIFILNRVTDNILPCGTFSYWFFTLENVVSTQTLNFLLDKNPSINCGNLPFIPSSCRSFITNNLMYLIFSPKVSFFFFFDWAVLFFLLVVFFIIRIAHFSMSGSIFKSWLKILILCKSVASSNDKKTIHEIRGKRVIFTGTSIYKREAVSNKNIGLAARIRIQFNNSYWLP